MDWHKTDSRGAPPHPLLAPPSEPSHKQFVAELFDTTLRALRRNRAACAGPELFLFERAFEDCLERVAMIGRRFDRALLIGCPDAEWPDRVLAIAERVDVRDPGPLFAGAADGAPINEEAWEPQPATYDLVLAIGTLDTVNDLPLALRLIRYALQPKSLLIGALSGGDTLPKLRSAMRAADAVAGAAAPHVHPRIEASALSPLLADAGFVSPVVDVDRVQVTYPSLEQLVTDLRAMGATNVLKGRAGPLTRLQRSAALGAFAEASVGGRTTETFELLHFAAWTAASG